MLRYQFFGCITFLALLWKLRKFLETADVFGKNGKYNLYLDKDMFLNFVILGIKLNKFSSALEEQIFLKFYKISFMEIVFITYIERNLDGVR